MDQKIKEIIFTLLVTATEGGSNYWYYIPQVDRPSKKTKYFQQIPLEGGAFWVTDSDNIVSEGADEGLPEPVIYPGSGTLKKVDLEALKAGWEVFKEKYPKHYSDAVAEGDDATTGDVFFQCVVFGEVIYG